MTFQRTNRRVLAAKIGDVTGEGTLDTVVVTGVAAGEGSFMQQIMVSIYIGSTQQCINLPLKQNSGYHPTVFLGDLTGNHADDILVVIDSGGSGATIYAQIFTYNQGMFTTIFDTESYNNSHHYQVNYGNNYQAAVKSLRPEQCYLLDLTYKGKDYLQEIYSPDGTLKEPIEGWVDPLSGLYPLDAERDGVYELNGYQRISGRYHADGLGYIENLLKWNGRQFTVIRQYAAIFGTDCESETKSHG
ncbi:hypothetical protein [Bacillus xiapuensis]|uniref:hypothetical protein n=1 Tax=Bacillus xiapuensis TaxID=2014075 RepID=UPI000C23C105|nr:hypothetical protein [Bacillus xiapuensis]